ncbi:MAG: DUF4190 domain-containing protein [Pyrinomonadaceae bacterium]
MKICPKCNERYDDDHLNFCLADGELLMDFDTSDAPPTMILDAPRVTNQDWGKQATDYATPQPQQQQQSPFGSQPMGGGWAGQNQQMSPYGGPQSPQGFPIYKSPDKSLPIVALVLGIGSLFFSCCYLGVIFGPGALILGYMGMSRAGSDPQNYGGKEMAIIGMVLGGIGMLASFGIIILAIIGSLN